jgi:hypothetical protein
MRAPDDARLRDILDFYYLSEDEGSIDLTIVSRGAGDGERHADPTGSICA